jgi:hypothetical protein
MNKRLHSHCWAVLTMMAARWRCQNRLLQHQLCRSVGISMMHAKAMLPALEAARKAAALSYHCCTPGVYHCPHLQTGHCLQQLAMSPCQMLLTMMMQMKLLTRCCAWTAHLDSCCCCASACLALQGSTDQLHLLTGAAPHHHRCHSCCQSPAVQL